jgi:cobalt/nickel transport protein
MRYRLEILTIAAVLAFMAFFLYTTAVMPGAEFAGSDSVGSSQIAALTGREVESFTPLIPQWEPPSGEIEAALFALQAACGGVVAGYIFGRWKGESGRKGPD